MNLNASLFMQCIVFLTLAAFTMKFIWPPLIKAIDNRRQQIADGLAAAEQGNKDKLEAEQTANQLLTEAKNQAFELVLSAQKQASEIIEQSKLAAQQEGHKQLCLAQDQINLEYERSRNALKAQLVTLSVAGAERIISKEIDEKIHAKLLQDLVAQL